MKQLLHIHGGESFDSYDAYWKYLEEYQIDDPTPEKIVKWRDHYEEFLGDEWSIIRPHMPGGQNNKYKEWALWLEKYLPFLKDNVVLVGHSLGANFLAKYLNENTFPVTVGQLHLVAGCYQEGEYTLPESLEGVSGQVSNIFIYHSHDDDVVPFADAEKYQKALKQAEIIGFHDRGHFILPEFPELMENIRTHIN